MRPGPVLDTEHRRSVLGLPLLCNSLSTVQKWEIGEKRPSGPSLKLLDVIERKGIDALA